MNEEEKKQLYLALGIGGRYSGKWGNMWPLWLNAWNDKTQIQVIRYWILRDGYLGGIVCKFFIKRDSNEKVISPLRGH